MTRLLLIINIGVWLIGLIIPSFDHLATTKLGLHYWQSDLFNPIQLISFQFLHGGFTHMFFNMFALFMFGSWLERVWGSKRYLIFYLICGIGSGLIQELMWSFTWEHDYIAAVAADNALQFDGIKDLIHQEITANLPARMENIAMYQNMLTTIGASGAIFGLLTGFAFVFPNVPMYIFFIPIPIKAKWVVLGYGLLEVVLGSTNSLSSIAHFAHLGGMLFALIIVAIWHKQGSLHGKRY